MKRRAGGASFLLVLCASLAWGQDAPPAPKDTAGRMLRTAWGLARGKHPDALLVTVVGRADASGQAVCEPSAPFQDGWRYTFYSPRADEFLMMAACQGATAGPLRQILSKENSGAEFPLSGRFIDSDVALETLAGNGVSLDPRKYKAGGRRPFTLYLYRVQDSHFDTHPVVWKVVVGAANFMIDADKRRLFRPEDYGVDPDELSGSTSTAASVLKFRPRPPRPVYTAKKDLARVLAFAQEKFAGSTLMAIDGFSNAWGGTTCQGAGDGWAYYFYWPKSRGFQVLFACDGKVGPGPANYIPADLQKHQPLMAPGAPAESADFADSNKIVDAVLIKRPSIMNEGMGRSYSRQATLRLVNHKTTPFGHAALYKTTVVWQMQVGHTTFLLDGKRARVVEVRDEQ